MYFDQIHNLYNLESKYGVTNDYFGILKDMELEEKKSLALETYKLIFRFSIEKLTRYLEDDSFIMIFLQYLLET